MASNTHGPFDAPMPDGILHGFAITTISLSGSLSIAWSFPGVAEPLSSVLLARSCFSEPVYSRFGEMWHASFPLPRGGAAAPASVRACAAVVWGSRYAPEAALALARVIAMAYASGGSAASTGAWLSALESGTVSDAAGGAPLSLDALLAPSLARAVDGSPPLRPLFSASGARALLGALGVEAVYVWTALAMRRRVAVLGASAAEASRAARVCAMLVAHRVDPVESGAVGSARTRATPADLLVPYVSLSDWIFNEAAAKKDSELHVNALTLDGALGPSMRAALEAGADAQREQLAALGSYVAGFTDPSVAGWGGSVWDVLVDVERRTVVVADSAKGALLWLASRKGSSCSYLTPPPTYTHTPPHTLLSYPPNPAPCIRTLPPTTFLHS